MGNTNVTKLDSSLMRKRSKGTVAANKLPSSTLIEVTLDEVHPMADGEITDNQQSYTGSGTDSDGNAYQHSLTTTGTVEAEWYPIGESNRMTAPDVRRGTQVWVWELGTTGKFYWSTFDNDLSNRKLETVIHGWSGTADESASPSDDNTYTFKVSTHEGVVQFKTTKANNEPYAYTFAINTADGTASLADDTGNTILLNSSENQIKLSNVNGCSYDMNGDDVTETVVGTKTLTANKWVVNVSESDVTSTKTTITSTTEHVGNLNLAGDLGTAEGPAGSGNITMAGKATITEGLTVMGDTEVAGLTASGTVSANQVVSKEPISAPNV